MTTFIEIGKVGLRKLSYSLKWTWTVYTVWRRYVSFITSILRCYKHTVEDNLVILCMAEWYKHELLRFLHLLLPTPPIVRNCKQ